VHYDLCTFSENKFVTHWFIGLEFAKSDGIKNVDLTYDIQSFTDLGEFCVLSHCNRHRLRLLMLCAR